MRGRAPSPRGLPFAVVLAALAAAVLPSAGGADQAGDVRVRADDLRRESASLVAQSRSALLGLYALEARLEKTRVRLRAAEARANALRRERAAARQRLVIARRALAVSERNLARQLRAIYEQGESDPLAVVLGAQSLDEGIDALEGLDRTAAQTRDVIVQTRRARKTLVRLDQSLAAKQAALERVRAAASAEANSLAQAREERAAYLARLVATRGLKLRQIASLAAAARAAEARSRTAVTSAAPPSVAVTAVAAPAARAAPTGRTMTVVATGYSLGGRTAVGLPVGWGIVAVDPAVIPLGTRLTIPGYGKGVAADTGSAVRGAQIDLWFPTRAQALAWGSRTVTITLG